MACTDVWPDVITLQAPLASSTSCSELGCDRRRSGGQLSPPVGQWQPSYRWAIISRSSHEVVRLPDGPDPCHCNTRSKHCIYAQRKASFPLLPIVDTDAVQNYHHRCRHTVLNKERNSSMEAFFCRFHAAIVGFGKGRTSRTKRQRPFMHK